MLGNHGRRRWRRALNVRAGNHYIHPSSCIQTPFGKKEYLENRGGRTYIAWFCRVS